MHTYTNRVIWKGGHLGHSFFENGADLEFSAQPGVFDRSRMMTPADSFMMAVNACLHMMFIWAAERLNLDLVSYQCSIEGEVEEFPDKTSWFRQMVLRPRITVRNGTEAEVNRALEMALKYSTITQSIKSEVTIVPDIVIQTPVGFAGCKTKP